MTIFVETLKRLYKDERITLEKVTSLLKDKKINQKQYDYIVSK